MGDKVDLGLIELRALILATIFSFIWGFKKPLDQFAPLLLHNLYKYSMSEVGAITFYLNEMWYIQITLLFAIFFYACNRNFINKIGSTIISAVIGNAVGFWVGYLASASLIVSVVSPTEWKPPIAVNPTLGQSVISLLIIEFAAIACAYLIEEWNRRLEQIGIFSSNMERPITVYVASILYAFLGIFLLIFSFIFTTYNRSFDKLARILPFVLFDFLLRAVASLVVSYGLYAGKRWGWLFAFISSILGTIVIINLLMFHLISNYLMAPTLLAYTIALLLNLILLICLLLAKTRQYFRFLNFKR